MWQTLKATVRNHQAFFDKEVSEWVSSYSGNGGRIYCGKGCGNCCSLAVNCTVTEAICIAEWLSKRQEEALDRYVAKLLDKVVKVSDLKSYLRMHREVMQQCPFLDDSASCGIYPVRPFSCRSLLSTKESRWCGTDFASLSAGEKTGFMDSLDQAVVSFPVHYVASTQEMGQALEELAGQTMLHRLGFSLSGNLPFLVWLEREHNLSQLLVNGYEATMAKLQENGLFSPFLLVFESN